MTKLLISSMICLSLLIGGCSHFCKQTTPDKVKVVCPDPMKPEMEYLSKDKTEEENMKIILYNLNEIIEYSLKQDSTIKCYKDNLKLRGE